MITLAPTTNLYYTRNAIFYHVIIFYDSFRNEQNYPESFYLNFLLTKLHFVRDKQVLTTHTFKRHSVRHVSRVKFQLSRISSTRDLIKRHRRKLRRAS